MPTLATPFGGGIGLLAFPAAVPLQPPKYGHFPISIDLTNALFSSSKISPLFPYKLNDKLNANLRQLGHSLDSIDLNYRVDFRSW